MGVTDHFNIKSGSSSSNSKDGWYCIFVDHIKQDGKITLTNNYGKFYTGGKKLRKSVPEGMNPGRRSNEAKFVKLLALATYFNQKKMSNSNGLLIRSEGRKPTIVAEASDDVGTHIKEKKSKNTSSWMAYISPDEEFYRVKDRKKGEKVSSEIEDKIREAIEYAENNIEK